MGKTPEERIRYSPTVAEIDLENLCHNATRLQQQAGRAQLMAVVKADAYGHGAVQAAFALQRIGVRWFGVATVPEALELREAGLTEPILVFAAPLPEYIPKYIRADLDITVPSRTIAETMVRMATGEKPIRAHVKIDTGMGRIGLKPGDVCDVVTMLRRAPGVELVGISTHLAASEQEDTSFTMTQIECFDRALAACESEDCYIHFGNSGALLQTPGVVQRYDKTLVRAGIALYGYPPALHLRSAIDLKPVMRFTTRVTQVKTIQVGASVSYGRTWTATRPTQVATLAVGYADGYPRSVSNRAEVGIRGCRYPVVGTVCMDMIMVDIGPDGKVQVGDEAVLFGTGGPSADEVAAWAGTISYEICCRVSARVPRIYIRNAGG